MEGKAPISALKKKGRHLIPFKTMHSTQLLILTQYIWNWAICVIDHLDAGNKQINLKLILSVKPKGKWEETCSL